MITINEKGERGIEIRRKIGTDTKVCLDKKNVLNSVIKYRMVSDIRDYKVEIPYTFFTLDLFYKGKSDNFIGKKMKEFINMFITEDNLEKSKYGARKLKKKLRMENEFIMDEENILNSKAIFTVKVGEELKYKAEIPYTSETLEIFYEDADYETICEKLMEYVELFNEEV